MPALSPVNVAVSLVDDEPLAVEGDALTVVAPEQFVGDVVA